MMQFNPSVEAARQLLMDSDLPVEDLQKLNLEHFLGYYDNAILSALVGLEVFGTDALLRSLVVAYNLRNSGIGLKLVRKIEEYAQEKRVASLYLLTNTAESYFTTLGYKKIPKGQAPTCVKQCEEFRSLCPDSAVLMKKSLGKNN